MNAEMPIAGKCAILDAYHFILKAMKHTHKVLAFIALLILLTLLVALASVGMNPPPQALPQSGLTLNVNQ